MYNIHTYIHTPYIQGVIKSVAPSIFRKRSKLWKTAKYMFDISRGLFWDNWEGRTSKGYHWETLTKQILNETPYIVIYRLKGYKKRKTLRKLEVDTLRVSPFESYLGSKFEKNQFFKYSLLLSFICAFSTVVVTKIFHFVSTYLSLFSA